MKIPVKTIVGIVGVTAAVVWSVHGVNFREVVGVVTEINLFLAVLVLLLTVVNLVVRAAVWKAVVRPMKIISLFNALSSYLVGVFSNLFLPFKLGDVAQGYSLGLRTDLSKVSSVTAVLVQRVFEITSLLIVMSLVAAVFSFPLLFDRTTLILGVILLLAVAGLVMLIVHRDRGILLIHKVLSRYRPSLADQVISFFERFIEGTRAIHSFSDISKILLLSILSWGVQISMTLYMARSLGIQLDFISASVVLMVINIGLLLPVAPGNIGTFQFFSILALSWFSVSKPKALTFAVLFQVVQGIPVIIGGSLAVLGDLFRSKTRLPRARQTVNEKR